MGPPDRRRHDYGRRASDEIMDARVKAVEKLLDALGPAVAQVARIDDAVDDLERWIEDERKARRQHNSDLLEAMREHRAETRDALALLALEVKNLKLDQRSGRRALITSMVAAAGTIVVALIGAAALIATHHP